MEDLFAERILGVPRSFIREILKASTDSALISFAGGLPNPDFFPVKEIENITRLVFKKFGSTALQYSNSEGSSGLREYIAKRYSIKKGITISPDNIIITNGSQQGIDLLSKVFLNKGDTVLIEEPGYLGAIQSLSMYQPVFSGVPVDADGMDIERLKDCCAKDNPKMMYCVPTFQNPSGITYCDENRQQVSEIAERSRFVIIEDDPYGELRFSGTPVKSFQHFLPEQSVLLGSFSKVFAPGFRLGWVAAPSWITEKLIVAKQAADLHTSSFGQKVAEIFLAGHDLDLHIAKIIKAYGMQCRAMTEAIAQYFPKDIEVTKPEGGMFLWGMLPEGVNSRTLFDESVKEKVVFVPGDTFYTHKGGTNAFRLNYSCVDQNTIKEGVVRMSRALDRMI